jgi:hypothetical protein
VQEEGSFSNFVSIQNFSEPFSPQELLLRSFEDLSDLAMISSCDVLSRRVVARYWLSSKFPQTSKNLPFALYCECSNVLRKKKVLSAY